MWSDGHLQRPATEPGEDRNGYALETQGLALWQRPATELGEDRNDAVKQNMIWLTGSVQSQSETVSADTVRGDLAHAAVDRAGPDQDRYGRRVWHSLPVVWGVRAARGVRRRGIRRWPAPTGGTQVRCLPARRPGGPAELQVAGQVLCLRQMFDAPIPVGVLFAGRGRRRYEVVVDDTLAARVVQAANTIRVTIASGLIPPPVHDQRCLRCSLRPGCEPGMPNANRQHLFLPRTPDLTSEM